MNLWFRIRFQIGAIPCVFGGMVAGVSVARQSRAKFELKTTLGDVLWLTMNTAPSKRMDICSL